MRSMRSIRILIHERTNIDLSISACILPRFWSAGVRRDAFGFGRENTRRKFASPAKKPAERTTSGRFAEVADNRF